METNESIEYPCELKMNRAIKTGMGDTFGPIAKNWSIVGAAIGTIVVNIYLFCLRGRL